MPISAIFPGFRRGMDAVEDAAIYLRRYRGLQKVILFATRVYFIFDKTKKPHLGVRDGGINSWNFAHVPLQTSPKPTYSAKMIAAF